MTEQQQGETCAAEAGGYTCIRPPRHGQCDGRLNEALFDLPWLRFVLSRYVPPTHGPGAPRWEWLNQ